MLMTQFAVNKYRHYRWLLSGAVGLAILFISLYIRYYQEVKTIDRSQQQLAAHTVAKIERLLQPASEQARHTMALIGRPCNIVTPTLRYRAAQNQALRSVLLVKDNDIYCSSLFGPRQYRLDALFPQLHPDADTQLALRPSLAVAKGVPTLIMWTPQSREAAAAFCTCSISTCCRPSCWSRSCPMRSASCLTLTARAWSTPNAKLSTAAPYAAICATPPPPIATPFTISLFGPSTQRMALEALPAHVPLALLISLLAAYVVYLITANRMSLSYHISHAINRREFQVYCQPIINGASGRCLGIEILLRWNSKRQGWISPDVFIPLAEQHGLINPLTRFLMTTVVENLALFPPRPSFYISINVAAEHFNAQTILADIRRIWLPANPMPSLMLELTERTALSEIQYEHIRAR
ncbi:phage resistance protein [Serratia rubidaea]|uniref:cyclic-guanylate-specific phosphodiesterase n=1 Tax=Serratia rubidaea TaxID=61652 RepID=A0A4U9HKJ9_SERRU|nr:phage resistance protein [Serratia rubidaea]